MAVINTNIASLNAQRNLGMSQSTLNTSIQRLSSGLRINSAKDDAAGLAISERMTSQIRGLNVAARNANDGVSLAQTAEGSLGKVGDMLQRMRELAVQSTNATNSSSDRTALQDEVAQLKAEIGRVATTTKFNGTSLLDGSFSAQSFQVGANSGETITLNSIANVSMNALGTLQTADAVVGVTAVTAVTAVAAVAAVPATATTSATSGTYVTSASTTSTDAFQFKIDGLIVSDRVVGASAANLDTDLATFLATTAGAGYTKTGTFAGADLVLSKTNGTDLVTATSFSVGVGSTTTAAGTTSAGTFGTGFIGTATNGTEAVAAVTAVAAVAGVTGVTAAAATTETGIANLTVATAAQAAYALTAIDTALTAVNTARGTLGAVQNRFESVVSNIRIQSENLSAARSRILDADYAAETANLTRGQILQQAGTAMLAQANSLPNNVLSLLRG